MLRHFLARQARAIEALTDEVQGLARFHARFQETSTQFQQALMVLAEPGYLQEGAVALQGALRPLETVQASLDEQFAVSDQLLATTGAILEQAAAQRARVEASSQRIADLLEQWTADELLRRQASEADLMRHYREAGAQSDRMTEGLLELRSSVTQLAGTLGAIERIAEALEALAMQQGDVVAAQQQAAGRLGALQEEAADQARRMQHWQEEVLASYRQAGAALANQFDRTPDIREQRRQTVLLGLVALLLLVLVLATWLY